MLLWTADYSETTDLNTPVPPWTVEQEPNYVNPDTNRITVVENVNVPGNGGPYRPTGRAMRVELHPYSASDPGVSGAPADGDVQDSNGYFANRAECYGRIASDPDDTPPADWPDPVGSERWYSIPLYIPVGWATAMDTTWLDLTQWKGQFGGSPPVAIEIKRSNYRLGGERANDGSIPNDGTLGPIQFGEWVNIVVGRFNSPDPTVGWVTAYLNGEQVISQTFCATMDYQSDDVTPDPCYLKQGIYRSSSWAVVQTAHFGPILVGETPQDVGLIIRPNPVAVTEYWGIKV